MTFRAAQCIDDEVSTVLERLLRAGIDPQGAEWYLSLGALVIDGVRVTDHDTPAAPSAKIVLLPGERAAGLARTDRIPSRRSTAVEWFDGTRSWVLQNIGRVAVPFAA
jgi:hypothetical protein